MERYNPDSDLPTSAMGVMRLMPSKTTEIATFAKQLIQSVKSGDANPLELLVMLRSLELVSELVREEIGDNVLTEAEKHSEKKFNAFGAIVERTELGTKYNYLGTGDLEYEQLHAEAQTANRRLKEREEFLKALKEPLTAVDSTTGEVYKINPPYKTSKSGVKVYLANVK